MPVVMFKRRGQQPLWKQCAKLLNSVGGCVRQVGGGPVLECRRGV